MQPGLILYNALTSTYSLKSIILVTWGLVLFTLPLPHIPTNSRLIILLFLLSIFYFLKNKPREIRYIKFHLYYLIPFLVAVISLILVSNQNIDVMEKELAIVAFPLITFFLLNGNFSITLKEYHILLLFFATSVLSVLLFTYIRSFFYSKDFFSRNFLTFEIAHPTYFSLYCGVVILIIVEFVKHSYFKKCKPLPYILIIGILTYMTLLSSRMPLIATIIVLLYSIFFNRASLRKKIMYGVVMTLLGIVLVTIIKNSPRLEYRFILALEKNVNTRLVSWTASLEIFKDYPLFGTGTGANQLHLDNYYKKNIESPQDFIDKNSHNYFLHILVTFGVVGALLFAFFWFTVIKKALHPHHDLTIKILLLYLLCSLTEVLSAKQKGIVFLYLFYSLYLLWATLKDSYPERRTLE